MSATLNAGSFRSDDTLYAASRTLKSYLRSILMRKWDPTDPKVRFGSKAETLDLSIRCPLYPRKRTQSGHAGMSALCQSRLNAPQQKHRFSTQSDADQLHPKLKSMPLEEDHALALGRLETALCQRVKLESSGAIFMS